MKLRKALLWLSPLVLAACVTEAPPEDTGFTVAANTTTRFAATYAHDGQWIQARVEYTPSSTLYELKTSLGTTLVHEGTAFLHEQGFQPDARTQPDGRLVLTQRDAEYALVTGLHAQLLGMGASERPTAREKGSTLYAAAYMTARVLGKVVDPASAEELAAYEGVDHVSAENDAKLREIFAQQKWPYPGYDDATLMPAELKLTDGAQNYNGGVTCCGPYACVGCDWSSSIACDDWCAAGDHCNQYHPGSGCGTAMFFPSGGVNNCPHSDASAVLAYGTGSPYYNQSRNYCYYHYTGYWNDCWSGNGTCW